MKSMLLLAARSSRALMFAFAVSTALPAMAQMATIGPFVDFTGMATFGVSQPLQTKTLLDVRMQFYAYAVATGNPPVSTFYIGFAPISPVTTCNPSVGGSFPDGSICGTWKFLDSINIYAGTQTATPIPVKGVSYFSYDTRDMTGNVRITTLYGLDLDPSGAQLALGGIEAGGPALEFSNETIYGVTGTPHTPSFAARLSLSELGARLGPGFDLSPIHGSPNSTVQVFQTDLLVSEIAVVPEPGTLAMLVGGLLAVGRVTRRRVGVIA